MYPQHTDAYTHTSARGILRPDAEADGVGATVVEDTREDGEGNLVTDVRDEFSELERHTG